MPPSGRGFSFTNSLKLTQARAGLDLLRIRQVLPTSWGYDFLTATPEDLPPPLIDLAINANEDQL